MHLLIPYAHPRSDRCSVLLRGSDTSDVMHSDAAGEAELQVQTARFRVPSCLKICGLRSASLGLCFNGKQRYWG